MNSKQEAAALFLIQCDPPCDVNARGEYRKTPLMHAASKGMLGVMEALVARDADVEAEDRRDVNRALHHALKGEQEAASLFLIQRNPPCDVNARDANDTTPLMYAARRGMVGVMEALVARDANVEAVDYEGNHALHYAIEFDQEAAALFLIQLDPPCVNARNTSGTTPLMHAAGHGLVGVMEALLAKGVDVEAVDSSEGRALHYALHTKQEAAALYLIQCDSPCDVNALDIDGKTPLMHAASSGVVGVMRALVAKGVDIEVADKKGKRALDHVLKCKQKAAAPAALFLKQCAEDEANRLLQDCPRDFLDPISHSLLEDPVVAEDGETCSRKVIQKHIDECKRTGTPFFSPVHGPGISMKRQLYPNLLVRRLVADYVKKTKRKRASEGRNSTGTVGKRKK